METTPAVLLLRSQCDLATCRLFSRSLSPSFSRSKNARLLGHLSPTAACRSVEEYKRNKNLKKMLIA